jgi:hypothetical protein
MVESDHGSSLAIMMERPFSPKYTMESTSGPLQTSQTFPVACFLRFGYVNDGETKMDGIYKTPDASLAM